MLNKKEILKILKNEKNFLRQEFHIKEIALFGSFASESENSKSDIDLIIEFHDDEIDDYISNKYRLKKYLENLFDREIDLCRKKYLKPYIKNQILESASHVE